MRFLSLLQVDNEGVIQRCSIFVSYSEHVLYPVTIENCYLIETHEVPPDEIKHLATAPRSAMI